MRALRRISSFICILLVFLLGVLLFATSIIFMAQLEGKFYIESNMVSFLENIKANLSAQVATLLIGLLLLLVSCLTLYLAIADFHSSGRIRLESPDGKLTVSVSAIEAYLSRLGREIEGVKDLRIKLRRTPVGWGLYARATVWSDLSISEINEKIRREMREGMVRVIGNHTIEPIDIHVTKIDDRGRLGPRRGIDVEFTS